MKNIFFLLITLMFVVSGCSQKEMGDGASDIGSDIKEFGDKIFKVRE